MISLKEFALKLKKVNSVAIFCHIRPDGDTIGSSVALKCALIKSGIKAEVFCDEVIPSKFFFLEQVKTIKKSMDCDFDAYVAVDCAEINRLGSFAERFSKKEGTFCIDHHISNTRYANYNYVLDNASNAENIYYLIKELGVCLDSEIANLLALGIVTDSGNFRHKNVTGNTLLVCGDLVNNGADLNKITYQMFVAQTKNRAKLFGIVMSNIRFFLEDKLAIATVRNADIEKCGAKSDDTEGFVDFVMGIDTVEVGICLMEQKDGKLKASLRSKSANVNEVAASFGGGGHVLASGCQFNCEYEEVVDKLVYAVKQHITE